MRRVLRLALAVTAGLSAASPVAAQFSISIAGYDVRAFRQEQLEENHGILRGSVELERGDTKLYADEVEFFRDRDLVIARGNVVLTQANSRIAADTAEFNTRTSLGTFHRASGIATVQPPRQSSPVAGIAVPTMSGQDTDVYFFGETVEKQGEKKYRITNGGFSTCVQPTPRWDLTADTLVLNIDHYTLLRDAIFKVKGVPMLYLPIMYFPTKEDGRATGFLLPTYGKSSLRGHTIHNQFFWAINRSHDATLLYDYYSKTGGGGGAEYRYNMGGGTDGNITAYRLVERETTYDTGSGTATKAAAKSYWIRGTANQPLPGRLLARANIDYFSSLQTNQTLNTSLNTAGVNSRTYGANVVGAWRSYSLNGTYYRNEFFTGQTSSQVAGTTPKINFSRSERALTGNSPVYFGAAVEFANLDRESRENDVVTSEQSFGRLDFTPQIRYPFKKWQWFTVNTSAMWRETYYTRSLQQATTEEGTPTTVLVDDNLHRGYGTAMAQAVGPVFTRIWDTPENGYAERFKHSVEPFVTLQRTTAIANRAQIVQFDSVDSAYGDTTQLSYGLNNRLYAKRRIGQTSTAQEIVALEVTQTYYSNKDQSLFDPRYTTGFAGGASSNFSPISTNLRVTPTPAINGTLRGEIDSRSKKLKTLSANANYNWAQNFQTSIGWSHKFFIADLDGYNNRDTLDHYLNLSANVKTRDNKYGLNTTINYDVLRSTMTQQRLSGFYNAQCCGLAFEYQRYSFAGLPSYVIPADNRFFLSFTLAGLGNFSPFSGGLNGVPR